jgi:hypothetical protein
VQRSTRALRLALGVERLGLRDGGEVDRTDGLRRRAFGVGERDPREVGLRQCLGGERTVEQPLTQALDRLGLQ